MLKSFRDFKIYVLNEEVVKNDSSAEFLITYEDDRNMAQRIYDNIMKASEEPEAKAKGDELISKGDSVIQSTWQKAWEKRIAAKVDEGKLKKEEGWYTGKGAWRINSNKAVKIGLKPDWMEWEDSLHNEIIEAYFPELLKEEPEKPKEEEELSDINIDDVISGNGLDQEVEEPEYVMASESINLKKFKYIKPIYEAEEDFTLGPPPESTEGEANVYTPDMLLKKLKRNFNMSQRKNVMIWGAPGVGKTQIVKQVAREIQKEAGGHDKLPVIVVSLSQMMPTDLNGVPLLIDKGGEGTEKTVIPGSMEGKIGQASTIPAWLPGLTDSAQGILFFDEINRADPDMLGACLTLLLDREAASGKYHMPTGWRVWAAGNRGMDTPNVTPLGPAISARFKGGHVHLVPTMKDWKDWARSEFGLFYPEDAEKPIQEFYIPDEFFAYLDHIEDGKGNPKYFDLKGDPVKTEFKQFYRFDKAKLTSGEEGVAVGYPSPRSWAVAWATIYDLFLRENAVEGTQFRDKVKESDYSDDKMKGLAAISYVLQDKEATQVMKMELGDVVGAIAAQDFMSYIKVLRRHSDAKGTINEKINNIFKDPSKPRPLVDIPPVNISERHAIESLIESHVKSMDTSMTMDNFLNWCDYMIELVKEKKVDTGEASSHVKEIIELNDTMVKLATGAAQALVDFKQKGNQSKKAVALRFKVFAETFREMMSGFKGL